VVTNNHDPEPNTPIESDLEESPLAGGSVGALEDGADSLQDVDPGPGVGPTEAPFHLEGSLSFLHDVVEDKASWNDYIKAHPKLDVVRRVLKLVWKYNPANTSTNRKTSGDAMEMRQDLLEASALGIFLSVQAGALTGAAGAMDHERKIVRDMVVKRIFREQAMGDPKWEGIPKLSVKDRESEGRLEASQHIRAMGEFAILGAITEHARVALRDFVATLQVLIPGAMREEAADARLR